MLSTIPATTSSASHSRRPDEIARSRGTQHNPDTTPRPSTDTAIAISRPGQARGITYTG